MSQREKVLNPLTGKMILKDGATWKKVQEILALKNMDIPHDVLRAIKGHADEKTKKNLNLVSKALYDKSPPKLGSQNGKVLMEFLKEGDYAVDNRGKSLTLTSSKYTLSVYVVIPSGETKKRLIFNVVKDQSDVPKVLGKLVFDRDTPDNVEFKGKKWTDYVTGARNQKIVSEVLADVQSVKTFFASGWNYGKFMHSEVGNKYVKQFIVAK